MLALSEWWGGVFTAMGAALAALIGWLGTRQSAASETADWLTDRMHAEIDRLTEKLDEAERHIETCDAENRLMRQRWDGLLRWLRDILDEQSMIELEQRIADEEADGG